MGPIIILICLIIILGFALFIGIFTKGFISKKNLAFFVPMLVILFFIYYLGYSYQGSVDFLTFIECLGGGLKGFKFEVIRAALQPYMKDNVIYAIDVYAGVIMSGLTLVSGVLGFFKVAIVNFCASNKRLVSNKLDIVFGYNKQAIAYAKKHNNSVLWVDPSLNKLSADYKKNLFVQGVAYLYKPFDGKKLNRNTAFAGKTIHIIVFQEDGEYLSAVLSTIEGMKNSNGKTYNFHVQANTDVLGFIDNKISKACKGRIGIVGSSFNTYELIGRAFSNNYNLAKFLPRSFYKDGTILPDKTINVVMLGFGKTARAVFKSILLNNQFVQIAGKKFSPKPINFYIYDKDDDSFGRSHVTYLENFAKINKKFSRGLETVELPYTIKHYSLDIKSDFQDYYLENFIQNKDSFTFYFVCLNNNIENAAFADQIAHLTSEQKNVIFYNVDNKKEAIAEEIDNVIPFGFKSAINSHQYITNDRLWVLAALQNKNYNAMKGQDAKELDERPIIEKQSNIYANINLQFKLNLLGLDYIYDEKAQGISEERFFEIYDKDNIRNKEYDFKEYLKINTRTALAYQEHLRWMMFYIINGYSALPFDQIKYEGGKIIHKDISNRKHACLISYYELEALADYEVKLTKGEQKLEDVETLKYDYQLLDGLFDTIVKEGYKIVEL